METRQQNSNNNDSIMKQLDLKTTPCYFENENKEQNDLNQSNKCSPTPCAVEPIDLTSNGNSSECNKIYNGSHNVEDSNDISTYKDLNESFMLKTPVSLPQNEGRSNDDILNAAKTLFSKRTRTLYHWMYPNASIIALKSAVAASWEKLSAKDKGFYVSQVLGRFGLSKNNVIVNPHLTCGINAASSLLPLDLTTDSSDGYEEANAAVSNLLLSEEMNSRSGVSNSTTENCDRFLERKRKRTGRPPGSKNKLKRRLIENKEDETFENDPELHREFEQFKWMMSLNNPNPSVCQ